MGIGPVNFVCVQLAKMKKEVHLYYGARNKSEVTLKKFPANTKLILATDDGSKGKKGFITKILEKAGYPKGTIVLACGPEPMLKETARICLKNQWVCHVSLERHMACGVGACNGCVIDTKCDDGKIKRKRVCKEGPVFNAAEVVWT